ncbi:energy transducer TonB [Sphingomonas sp. RS6]
MRYMLLAAAVSAALPSIAEAEIDTPARYDRVGAWEINYDRDSCHLYARFGQGDDTVFVSFTRYSPGFFFELRLYGKPVQLTGGRRIFTLDFGTGKHEKFNAILGSDGDLAMAIMRSVTLTDVKDIKDAAKANQVETLAASVTGMDVKPYGKRSFHLEFGNLAKPFAALQTCTEQLIETWGFDPKVQLSLQKPPEPKAVPSIWLTPDDYPDKASRDGYSGLLQFRLNVDADGNVSSCHILARTEPDLFATPTCRAMMRKAKFDPAIDANGNPVASYFVSSVLYNLVR